jgi:ADP-heptose:LPS heptosyltransferase
LQRNAEFISHLSGISYTAQLPEIPVLHKLSPQLLIGHNYCVIFPGATWAGRQWPAEKFANAATSLATENNWKIVLAGGHNDQAICNKVAEGIGHNALNLCGKTSLPELIELIRHCALLICNETSVVHIAAAVGTPAVCILGGGHFGRFLPYPTDMVNVPIAAFKHMACFGCNWQCSLSYPAQEAVPCIQQVEVEDICNIARQLIINKDNS